MPSRFRRVAVTGAAGYIARRLIAEFEQDESIERIVATDSKRLNARGFNKVVFSQQDITAQTILPPHSHKQNRQQAKDDH